MTPLSNLAPQPRIVIIGLGVVGAALADELTARGMSDVTVLDQGPLWETGGSSSHAPGFAFQTNPNRVMATLARRTLDKLDGLLLGDQWLLKRSGGLEIATTPERLHDLRRRVGLAHAWGIPAELVGPDECARLWPGLDVSSVLGGLHTPTDAVVKAVPAVRWQAERAIDRGARVRDLTRVTGIRRESGRVTGVEVVPVPRGDADPELVPADVVIACAGLWGPELAREMLGFELPMRPMEHCFGISDPVPALIGRIDPVEELRRPMLRHQDFSMYVREYGDRIGIGAYNHRPMLVPTGGIASADDQHATGAHPAMHPLTWDDFAPSWDEARRLLPELRDTGFGHGFNGIFSFTPDGGPMLGPVPGTDGLWLAQAVWVTQSAGVAEVMADWIVSDDPGIDTHGLDFSRFDPAQATRAFADERAEEAYDEVYDVLHPQQPTARLRGIRTSPFHSRHEALGAVFGEGGGWERPLWFEANAPLLAGLDAVPQRDPWGGRVWSPIAAAEAHATRNGVALYDMSSLPRLEVEGEGATELLQGLVTADVDRPVGAVVYALMLDERGGILSDVTVTRLGPERYLLGVNGHLDRVHLEAEIPPGSPVRVRTVRGECGLGLWGPKARDVLEQVTRDDVSHTGLRYFRAAEIEIAGAPVLAQRVSYVGELGWELYTPAEFGRWVWDRLWEAGRDAGIIAAGRSAFNSLRLEKGYRLFGTDMSREDIPAEAGLDFAVRMSKPAFVGRDALAAQGAPARRLVTLTLDDPGAIVLGSEPVYRTAEAPPIGWITSADQGYTVGRTIAYAWLPAEDAEAGTALEVEYFGVRLAATVRTDPLVDPDMTHILR
ncbi:GcvT family protein [Microbacterium thalassium]|uniref:Glycine cleavage system aminomethyltransferase T/glycine/D-amino acid oxidase-like deaminating enzyme n=1 Tax=Microbacterium thalassium TaxID=362649 RepID=A0A7X0FPT8_9MICO|nr:FAD-dependent oxidoreductase [Microbacterium thalassium]MBB6391371.1 glycine cleavage system aminomethyltransferase T/glycine/D-amino acid oxidase-like deaminating enzyme [Microbacterium thalassium]GLK23331.1 sarcosine dehydrogenase [Microbacterium thalassium]